MWGFAGSPLIIGELAVVVSAANDADSVLAYDRLSGDWRWSGGGGTYSYSSAQTAHIQGMNQLLVCTDFGLQSFHPQDGNVLWQHAWASPRAERIVQPLVLGDDVIVGTGYGVGTRRVSIQRDGAHWSVAELWTSKRFRPYFNDFVFHQRYLYGIDGGVLVCVDAVTGKREWKRGRYGAGQLLLVADIPVLLVMSENGDVVLVEPTPNELVKLASFSALRGKTWSHPVIAQGRLFVRNGEEAACFELN